MISREDSIKTNVKQESFEQPWTKPQKVCKLSSWHQYLLNTVIVKLAVDLCEILVREKQEDE